MDDYEKAIEKLAVLINNREHYQRILGRTAYNVSRDYGAEMLNQLSEDLKEAHGLKIAPTTLRNYAWVYKRVKDLELPDDLPFRTLQQLSASADPAAWAKRIVEEGLSSSEVYKMLQEEKGREEKIFLCPSCKAELKKSELKPKK